MNITKEVLCFRDFLNISWDSLQFFLKNNDNYFIDDWLQANWELLLESRICKVSQFLQIYGSGGDSYGEFSRITFYDKVATHKIVGVLKKSTLDILEKREIHSLSAYTFYSFVNVDNNILNNYKAPFNYVEFEHDNENIRICVNCNDIEFYLEPL